MTLSKSQGRTVTAWNDKTRNAPEKIQTKGKIYPFVLQ